MLGRMRISSWTSLEELEMERSASSKHIKDDSLSIYGIRLSIFVYFRARVSYFRLDLSFRNLIESNLFSFCCLLCKFRF